MDDLFVVCLSLILMPLVILLMIVGVLLWSPFMIGMWLFGKVVGAWDGRTQPFDHVQPDGIREDVK